MSKRILFLDDNPARQRWATRELGPGNRLTSVDTAEAAIHALGASAAGFDAAYLDHDLVGDEVNVDPSRKDCGSEVVRWIVANRPAIGRVVVHSLSQYGGLMAQALIQAGYQAECIPFLRLAQQETCWPRKG